MSKFICRNAECPNCGKIDEYFSNTYKMVDGHLVSNNAPCPKCGQIREEIVPGKDIPLSEKNIYLTTYTMAAPEERREMVKKRSHEHYEKELKPFNEHQINAAVKQFKDASK